MELFDFIKLPTENKVLDHLPRACRRAATARVAHPFVNTPTAPYMCPRAIRGADGQPAAFPAEGGMMRDPVAAVIEAEATGEVAAIFADIQPSTALAW